MFTSKMNNNFSTYQMALSIPEIATELIGKTQSQSNENTSRTLLIVGSKSVGKSTLLYSFLEKNEVPRETMVIEYSFGRKTNQKQGIDKTICHIWEYGGKLETLNSVLQSIPIHGKYFFCIMVDLSKVKSMWNTLEMCVESFKKSYSALDSSPELIIIGGKYDLFKNYESEVKKFICTTIRSVGLLFNAHIIFYSSKDPQLARKAKDMLQSISFGNCHPIKDKNTSFTKPLFIARGSDSWDSIGIAVFTLEQVKTRHLSHIPSNTLADVSNILSSNSQQHLHPESVLDSLINQKYGELRSMDSLDIAIDYLPTI